MDESTLAHGAAPSSPRPVSCAPWCTDSRHDGFVREIGRQMFVTFGAT